MTIFPKASALPAWGPIATGLGEIYLFEVKNDPKAEKKRSLMELRTILDWDVARPLLGVPGVIEVNTFGGELKTYQVRLDPNRLLARGISMTRVFEALKQNNSNSGGGYIERNGQVRVIRAQGLVSSLKDIEDIVLDTTPTGTPIYIRDVGEVQFAPMIRQGVVTRDGRGEVVTATVLLLAGKNGRIVVEDVKAKLKEIGKTLPEGVVIDSFYDRSTLINKAIGTVVHNLAEGGVLVMVVLLIMLGNVRSWFDRGAGDPAVDAVRGQPDALLRCRRQPDEPRCDRLRPDRR